MKVLVVEDHPALRSLLVEHLLQAGFAVDGAECGREAQALLEVVSYDAMILDLGLPDMDGMVLLEKRRHTVNADLPCIILTARDAVQSRVDGLNTGADDYILKPFDMLELEARLRAVLRRPGSRMNTRLRCGNLMLEPETRLMSVEGQSDPVALARREAIGGQRVDIAVDVAKVVVEKRADHAVRQFGANVGDEIAHPDPSAVDVGRLGVVAQVDEDRGDAGARQVAREIEVRQLLEFLLDAIGDLSGHLGDRGAGPVGLYHHGLDGEGGILLPAEIDVGEHAEQREDDHEVPDEGLVIERPVGEIEPLHDASPSEPLVPSAGTRTF